MTAQWVLIGAHSLPTVWTRFRTPPALLNRRLGAGLRGVRRVPGGPAESGARGPAIRYALPPRPPERSRGTTGRPALCPFDAGAAHLAAAAPKRARRPGALRAGCLGVGETAAVTHVEAMSGGEKRWSEAWREYCRRVPPRLTSSSAGKTTPPSSPRHRSTLGDLRRQGSMP